MLTRSSSGAGSAHSGSGWNALLNSGVVWGALLDSRVVWGALLNSGAVLGEEPCGAEF